MTLYSFNLPRMHVVKTNVHTNMPIYFSSTGQISPCIYIESADVITGTWSCFNPVSEYHGQGIRKSVTEIICSVFTQKLVATTAYLIQGKSPELPCMMIPFRWNRPVIAALRGKKNCTTYSLHIWYRGIFCISWTKTHSKSFVLNLVICFVLFPLWNSWKCANMFRNGRNN